VGDVRASTGGAGPGFLGYLRGPRVGAMAYNITHAAILPMLLGIFAMVTSSALAMHLSLIWCAHIGSDRASATA
jgi:hypothetical protein